MRTRARRTAAGSRPTSSLRSRPTSGINGKKLVKDANSKATTKALVAAAAEATKDKVQGTPSFEIINPPAVPQELHETSLAPAGFVQALSAAIG